MANTYTLNYSYTKPEVGADTNLWGTHLNQDLDAIDAQLFKSLDKTLTSSQSLAGAITIPSNGLNVGSGQLQVTGGNVSTTGNISAVNGTFGGTLAVTGTSSHTGNSTFGGTLGVTGAAVLSSTLAVSGVTTLASNGLVVGSGQLQVTGGNVTASGNITASGSINGASGNITGNVVVSGTVSAGGANCLTTSTYNSFAPTLTGGNASGTWGINVTGNAGSSNSCSGNAATATLATKASTLSANGGNGTAMTFYWSGQGGQPTWLWGGNDGSSMYVYNPSNFSVNYANSAGSASSASSAPWSGISGKPTTLSGYGITDALNLAGGTMSGNFTIQNASPTIVMADTDNGTFQIHCNSANIGFLGTAGGWISKTDNSGNFVASGNVTAYSDERLKDDIHTIEYAVAKLKALRGVYYKRKDSGAPGLGVIAQEVQQIFPEVVHENEDGMLSVAYGNLVGVLIEAVKELADRVEELEYRA